VVVCFDSGRVVIRSGPPNRLFVGNIGTTDDYVVAEQTDVDRIVGFDRDRFLQSVLFGQRVPAFLDLSIPDRGVLLDSVLRLGLWLELSERAGQRIRSAESDRVDLRERI